MDSQTVIRDLTLMLLCLTSWEEGDRDVSQTRSRNGYDFDAINELEKEGLIYGSKSAKTVNLTDEALVQADELFARYGIIFGSEPEERRFFKINLEFDFTELTCTRTLLVPEHTSFEDFHTMIQACFGWMNYHLCEFVLTTSGGKEINIAWPDYDTGLDPRLGFLFEGEEVGPWFNPVDTYLDDVFPMTREAVYRYDFGDNWKIRIHILSSGETPDSDAPICVDGQGDAPCEDSGGEGGFIRFLKVIEDPEDEEHEHLVAWGTGQGFERFSKAKANKRLSHWKDWARTDINKMDEKAQMTAFGRIIEEPIEQSRERYLRDFEKSLRGLSPKTASQHVHNVDYFFRYYLGPMRMSAEEGLDSVEYYLGVYLVRDDEYSTDTFLKRSATSLNKFYSYMADTGAVPRSRAAKVQRSVKSHLNEWVAKLNERFQDM